MTNKIAMTRGGKLFALRAKLSTAYLIQTTKGKY